MNNKGEINLQGLMISIAFLTLLVAAFLQWIIVSSPVYDVTGYDTDTLGFISVDGASYGTINANLSSDLEQVSSDIDSVVVDKGAFDFFAAIFNKVTEPFKTVYKYFRGLRSVASAASDVLLFSDIVKDFLIVFLTTTFIIGLVMVKYFLGRDKNS